MRLDKINLSIPHTMYRENRPNARVLTLGGGYQLSDEDAVPLGFVNMANLSRHAKL